jgi:hypothetical protein
VVQHLIDHHRIDAGLGQRQIIDPRTMEGNAELRDVSRIT